MFAWCTVPGLACDCCCCLVCLFVWFCLYCPSLNAVFLFFCTACWALVYTWGSCFIYLFCIIILLSLLSSSLLFFLMLLNPARQPLKDNRTLGLLWRSLTKTSSKWGMSTTYHDKTFSVPEYSCSAWDPYTNKHIRQDWRWSIVSQLGGSAMITIKRHALTLPHWAGHHSRQDEKKYCYQSSSGTT